MDLKYQVKKTMLKFGIIIQKKIPADDILDFIKRFRDKYEPIELIRVGGDGDGGYLLPNNLDSVSYCFSPGVDYTANFEAHLSKSFGIKSFMADASVQSPPMNDDNFLFTPKFLGSKTKDTFITLSDWILESLDGDTASKILQMDIEGSEYDVLTLESAEALAQFDSMIIEFHGLHNIFQRDFFRMVSAIFEKIFINFSICHVHPNNCRSVLQINGVDVPDVIEVTFLRNDLIEQFRTQDEILLPHRLDSKNVERLPDIQMPEMWWKQENSKK